MSILNFHLVLFYLMFLLNVLIYRYLLLFIIIIYSMLTFVTYTRTINDLANTVIVKVTTKFSIANLSQPDTLI